MLSPKSLYQRRKMRSRYQLEKKSAGRIRLTVHRSGAHIYAQVIDDKIGNTLAAASSIDTELKGKIKTGANKEAAAAVGELVAVRALKAGVKQVVFDRSGYRFHGRVAELAEAARKAGLDF